MSEQRDTFLYIKSVVVFSAVVETGSFRKASELLSISPPVVSEYIGQLEEYLGVPLFYRSTRKVTLTEYGHRFQNSSNSIASIAQRAFSDFKSKDTTPKGKLTITYPAALASQKLTNLIALFNRTYPQIELDLVIDNQPKNMIADGIDLAIRVGWLQDSNLKAKKITKVERVICANPDYFKNIADLKHPKELSQLNWIKTELLTKQVQLTNIKTGENASFTVEKGIRIRGANLFKQFLVAGFGLALGPKFLFQEDIDNGSLIHILPEWQAPSVGMYFVWVDNRVKNPLIDYFIEFTEKHKTAIF